MFPNLKPLLSFACLLCLCSWPVHAQVSTWQEHRTAGLRAFNDGDHSGAVEQFEAALTIAYESRAGAEYMGWILENLAAAYFTVGRHHDARGSIERWDKILAQSGDEPWVPQQQTVHDRLAPMILETSGYYAIHLESVKIENNIQSSWAHLKAAYPSFLADKALLVKRVDLDGQGTFYRILAAPFAASADAEKACRELQRREQHCALVPTQ